MEVLGILLQNHRMVRAQKGKIILFIIRVFAVMSSRRPLPLDDPVRRTAFLTEEPFQENRS